MIALAIAGMAVQHGDIADIETFSNLVYDGLHPDKAAGSPLGEAGLKRLITMAVRDSALREEPAALIVSHLPSALAQAGQMIESGAARIVAIGMADVRGGGALALCRPEQATHPYAVIEASGIMPAEALKIAGVSPAEIGYLELAQMMPESLIEAGSIVPAYKTGSGDLTCGLGGGFGGILAAIRAALALYHRYIPPVPGWKAPAQPAMWEGGPFYTLTAAKAWFPEGSARVRRAGVGLGDAHLILREAPRHVGKDARPGTYLESASPYLFLVSGADAGEIYGGLESLARALDESSDLAGMARRFFLSYAPEAPYALALVGRNADELRKEIGLARTGLRSAFQTGEAWATPGGSYFTPEPLRGEVAFVYPGAFSAYPRMGQDLFYLFPDLFDDLRDATSDLGRSVGDRWLYARSLAKQSTREWRLFRERLEGNPAAMMEAGMTFSAMVSRIMRKHFKIAPRRAFGYSLGEGSMLWGMGVWKDGDQGARDLHDSPLFAGRLFGPKRAIREMWGLPDSAPDDFWSVYFLSASADQVMPLLRRESRVYLTHINTPREVTIAGESTACKRIVEALGCEHLHAPFSMVMHCEPAVSEYGHFFRLHHRPVYERPDGVTFYASADYEPTVIDQGVLGHNISRAAVKMLDFVRLVERVYDDGARIFMEMGPRNACTRWVSETLGTRPHLSVAINQPGVDDRTGIVRMIARLIAHRVSLDASPLFAPPQETVIALSPTEGASYAAYLNTRAADLRQLAGMVQGQIAAYLQGGTPATGIPASVPVIAPEVPPLPPPKPKKPALFDEYRIGQFATGSVVACFGEEYRIYENRRAPRIPNGDLLLVSRVLSIDGTRHELTAGSSTVSEYDMPVENWFYRDNARPGIPYSVYMEMALQLCGFLSAYLGSTLTFPDLDFYFRNLDGEGTLTRDLDLRGKTITNHVSMTSSITMQGIILQKFTFRLSTDGEPFYTGTASFGCFTAEAMANQVGLDKGQPVPTWLEKTGTPAQTLDLKALHVAPSGQPRLRLSDNQLDFVDEVQIVPGGGKYGQGYILTVENVNPDDWFFTNHFYQDPVMPGSLGVEATLQAMQAYALAMNLGQGFRAPHFAQADNHHTLWRYRGQVTRKNKKIWMEIHIKRVERTPERLTVVGDASLWRDDGLRIYEVIDAAVCIVEGK